jgi:hypothetical protein
MTLLLAILACSEGPSAGPEETPAPTDTARAGQDDPLDNHIAANADPTPVGAIRFAIDFEPEGSSVVGVTKQAGFTFTFAFDPDKDHGFRFTETGSLGGFTQSHVLIPDDVETDDVHWVDSTDPDVLGVTTHVDSDSLVLDVMVRGEHHATLDLQRQ